MDDERIKLTQDIVDEIHQHRKRTQVGSIKLLKLFSDEAPKDLKHGVIDGLLNPNRKTVSQRHIDFILKSYRSLPDNNNVIIELTSELVQEITHHRKRTGVGSTKLINTFIDQAPKDLKYSNIECIAKYAQKTTKKNHVDFILNAYRSLPDNDEVIIELTPELVREIKYHQKRTGAGPIKLLKASAYQVPRGLKPSIISNILSLPLKTARQNHIDFILYTYRSLPDIDTYMIDDETIDEIKSHIERTGVGAQALLKGKRNRMPKGLNSTKIQTILKSGAGNVKREYVDFILNEYRTLPDWDDIYMKNNIELQNELRILAKKTDQPIKTIFRSRHDLPDGLSISCYSAWFNPKNPTSSIKREHYTYLIKLFKSLAG